MREFIRTYMELHGLKQFDLVPIFKTKLIVSAVLNGKRQLRVEPINKLACFSRFPTSCFLSR